MDMKSHITAALREQFTGWQELFAGLDEERASAPIGSSGWSMKDVAAHLMAWQQRTNARLDAALLDREPVFPAWPEGIDPEADDADPINAWIYETYHGETWTRVRQSWKDGYQRILASAEAISEKDLLDGSRYPWLRGFPLALILLATYDHHQEHHDMLQRWREGQK